MSDAPPPTAKRTPADWLVLFVATGGFAASIPPYVATTGALWGLPLAWLLHRVVGWEGFLPVLACLWIVGVPLCGRAARLLGGGDPRAVTYDEYVTVPLVFFGAPSFDWSILAVGFGLHRLFDVAKPYPICRLEKLPGGWGVMADDCLAAVFALVVMH
ncbi:MAG: phosphatidylglycerophosphatase A family protein, partial [Planctomycetia bacterium]